MIHVIAAIEVAAGRRDAFLAEFHRVMPFVHAEVGCLEYGPTIDVATGLGAQAPLRENVVTIVEKWESLDALRAHTTAPHMNEYRDRVKGLVVGVKLQVLQPA
jgi:quinol monooxygenase YgiN